MAALATMALAVDSSSQEVRAVRIQGDPPDVDGRLTEPVWQHESSISNLVQREPREGEPAPERTEVRFAFDDEALFIGARMWSERPGDIVALVTRRDREGSSERLVISLDTYRDGRTAYTFAVTPAGVRIDYFHGADFEFDRDYDYDPVWEADARIDSTGWTAEIRIPFTQLRFSPRAEQEWGVNVVRYVPARNEQSYWRLIRRQETGWASRMGRLVGIRDIRPSRRIELSPYVAANSRFQRVEDPADPFDRDRVSGVRAGGELKMGLGPNLTLDMTLNPDFGQVEADPAIVNLSAYEVFFDERRPFFLERSELFERRGLFYSRRIGAPPPGRPRADYAESPDNTTILGAARLTGRLPSGLTVAGLTAVTNSERVRTFDATSGRYGRQLVAPRSLYAVASVQQEFGADNSTIGGMITAVQRDIDGDSALTALLPRAAYSGIVEGRYRWAGGGYDVNSWISVTDVMGDSAAILRQQLSSRRYWQRVDASHVEVDPTRRGLLGSNFGFGHSKLAGSWRWDLDYTHETPGFEPNDIGAQGAVDNRRLGAFISWRQTEPRRWYRRLELGYDNDQNWSWEGLHRYNENSVFTRLTLPNFWRAEFDIGYRARGHDDRLTRGGPVMRTPSAVGGSFELESASGARNEWNVDYRTARDEIGGWERDVEIGLVFRPGDRWELRFDPEWTEESDPRQFVTREGNGRAATFGNRYIFARADVSEISARLRVNYTFTPNLTLETYAEPFAASGRFRNFGETLAPRSMDLLEYGTAGTTIDRLPDGSWEVTADGQTFTIDDEDFNERSFRSNVVLRWEWRLGSTMYLVWQQSRERERPYAYARPGDLFDSLKAPGNNFLALKVSYWLPLR